MINYGKIQNDVECHISGQFTQLILRHAQREALHEVARSRRLNVMVE